MEQNKKDQKFSSQSGKKTEMPQRKREDISSGAKMPRPEIDLPLKGGKYDSDLASKNRPQKDDVRRQDRNDYEKSSR